MGKIKETLELLKGSNKLVEIRIFKEDGVISGYYNDYNILERDIEKYNGKYDIYMTLNSIRDDIVNFNNMNVIKKSSICTRDCDIVKRDYIMIDIDVIKKNNTLSDDLHLHAIKKASMIRDDLIKKEGFNENSFCLFDSGNGAHLLLAINEDNTVEVTSVIKKFLNALADNYNDGKTKVDICTSNAARLTRLYYTYNCKGKKTGGECRQSQLLEKIDDLVIINEDFSKIRSYVNSHYHDCRGTNTYQSNEEKIWNHFDLDKWLASHNTRVLSKINADYGTIYRLADCPFDTGHDKDTPGAYIIKYENSGFINASCHHEKCKTSDHCNWDYIWNKFEKNKDNPNNVIKQARYKNSQKQGVTAPFKTKVSGIDYQPIISTSKST